MPKKEKITLEEGFETATGVIPYTLTNDFMFKVILQDNEDILRSLVSACLAISPDSIKTIMEKNPIRLGESFDGKTFILDLNILMNDDTSINIEIQVNDLKNWPDRSIAYLSRSFDDLNKGVGYQCAKSAYHIGFLDYTLFEDYPEFFSKYQLLNIKNHNLYSSKFNLFVVDLSKINLATQEDIDCGLERWARMFKAKTWEDLRMIAEKDKTLKKTAQSLYVQNNDDFMREYCRRRDEQLAWEESQRRQIAELSAALTEKDAIIARLTKELEQLNKSKKN